MLVTEFMEVSHLVKQLQADSKLSFIMYPSIIL